MSAELWRWVPMLVPFEALPRIAAELSGAPLDGPEADRVTAFVATTNPGLVRRVVRRWSGVGVVVELTQHVHEFSERGEPPTEDSAWDARISWEADRTTLSLDGTAWGRAGAVRTIGACVYRFSGDRAKSEVLERRWLEIIQRDFFRPQWPAHPLVPELFRTPLTGMALVSDPHTLSHIGKRAHYPALFCTGGDPAWGMIVAGERALPIGPLPKSPNTFVVNLERPSGGQRRDAVDLFKALISDAPSVEQSVTQSGSERDALGCVSLAKMPDRVKYAMWRGAGWIVRSQLAFKSVPARASRHGAFEFEWAIQSEHGRFALFARQTQWHDSEHERLTLCVVARWPRWTYLRSMRHVFAADGWTWLKLHPGNFWW